MYIDNLQNQFIQPRDSRTPTSASKVYTKRQRAAKLIKANISDSSRLKYISKSFMHRRNADNFDGLYNTSPLRKIQKLREARKSSLREPPRKNQENHTEMVKKACDLYCQNSTNLKETTNFYRKTIEEKLGGFREATYRTSNSLMAKLRHTIIKKKLF